MVVMETVATRRARTTVIGPLKIINCLLDTLIFQLSSGAHRKFSYLGRNVIDHPMMPSPARSIGIIAKQNKTASSRWNIAPLQRRRDIFAITREATWD